MCQQCQYWWWYCLKGVHSEGAISLWTKLQLARYEWFNEDFDNDDDDDDDELDEDDDDDKYNDDGDDDATTTTTAATTTSSSSTIINKTMMMIIGRCAFRSTLYL